MKTTFKISVCCLSIFWIMISCSKDDLEMFVVNDFSTNIDENPSHDQLIGIIPYEVKRGVTEFIITSLNVPNAIRINNSPGLNHASIYVQDAALFDYETNPLIMGTVQVNRVMPHLDFSQDILDTKIITVTINLIDLPEKLN